MDLNVSLSPPAAILYDRNTSAGGAIREAMSPGDLKALNLSPRNIIYGQRTMQGTSPKDIKFTNLGVNNVRSNPGIRLAVVSPVSPPFTGISQYGAALASAFRNAYGIDSVTLVGYGPQDRRFSAFEILQKIRTLNPNVVWFNLSFSAFGASRRRILAGYVLPTIFRSLGIPTVVTMHEIFDDISLSAVGVRSEWTVRAGGRIATRLALNADVTCVTLARHESQLRRLYRTTNVRHIPHGSLVEPELLPHRSGHREQKLLFLGCLSPHKGLSVLLASFKRFRRRGGQARLLIVGDDHPRFSTYCGEVRAQLSDTDGVEYVGAQPEVRLRKLFSDSTAVVLPYLASTGASSVLYRAAALGRPAILSDLDELRASAEEVGLQAEYVPPNDSVALATTIERLLRDEIRMEALARHNVAIMRRYTPTEICNLYVDVFRQVLDGRSKRRIV